MKNYQVRIIKTKEKRIINSKELYVQENSKAKAIKKVLDEYKDYELYSIKIITNKNYF